MVDVVVWFVVELVVTESGVASLGGVGGKLKRLWWFGWWFVVMSGEGGLLSDSLPNGLHQDGFAPSLSQGCRGAWKCGLQTVGDDVETPDMRAAATAAVTETEDGVRTPKSL